MISLDNIDFYHHPPPPKPPAHTSSSSGWKSYHVPSAPQSLSFPHPLSHPLPPKPPTAVTAVTSSTIKGRFQCAVPRNIFDIELENVSGPVVRETDLEADHESGFQPGNGLGDRCEDASPSLVTSSMTSELPVIPAGTDDCEGGENQLVTRRSALRDQLDTWPQTPGDDFCSGPISTGAEADLGYSSGRSVSAVVDNLLGDSHCLPLSLSGCDAGKQRTTIDGAPKHSNSQLPSPALSNPASSESKCRARPGQHHGILFKDSPSEAAYCGEQTRALTGSASNSPTATPSITSSRDTSTDCEDNISVLPSLNWQPRREGKQLRSNPPPRRVLRSRVNAESNRHDRPSSVAVVIPVPRSASSMAGTSRVSLVQPSHRVQQAGASCDSEEDQPTDSFTGNYSLFTRKSAADGGEHPRKRRRRELASKTAQNTSVSARCHSDGCIAAHEAPSGVDFLTSPGEAQEIFGRGIIRIQPHGQRHAYFLTFLPDAVDHPPSHVQPRSALDRPVFTKRAPYRSPKACAVEKGNVQLARRQTQNQRTNPKTRNNHSTRHKNSRKGKPWSPEEEELLGAWGSQGIRVPTGPPTKGAKESCCHALLDLLKRQPDGSTLVKDNRAKLTPVQVAQHRPVPSSSPSNHSATPFREFGETSLSSADGRLGQLRENGPGFNADGIGFLTRSPSLQPEPDVHELVMSILSLGPGASVTVHSLAINPVDRNSKVATLSFHNLPVSLSEESKKDQWKFELPADGDEDTLNTNRTLILDTHFTGFTPLQHSEEDNCDVDVIAISGLGGHAFGSFKERGGHFMWLRDTLPLDFPNARILIYGYDTQLVGSSSFQNLTDLGRGLLLDIKGIREPSQSRPILFIGHSLGGLVIKEAICKLKEETDEAGVSILQSTCGFLFFGVPHQGMAIESLDPLVRDQANQGLLESLGKNSALLMRLEQDFGNTFSGRHIPINSFYETEMSPTAVKRDGRWGLSGPSRVFVDVSSATCGSKHQHPMGRSHSEMVKYSHQYDTFYQRVKTVLQPLLRNAQSMRATVSAEAGNNASPPHSTKSIVARESHFCVPFGRNRDFVGRESILKLLFTIIPPSVEVDDCQRTAIEGLGGVGKTQIALEAAFGVRDQYPGCSIFWVPALNATSFENAYREIGRQIGVNGIDEDKADVKTLVKEALSRESSGHWLLIIDNADDPHLFFGGMALSDCLPFSRKGSVLFTTRRREVAVRLDIPERNIVTTEEMNEPEAMDLLLKGLNSHGSNLEDVKSLVVFLEKLPLAIKQASAYIAQTLMPVAKYLDHCKSSDKTLIKLLSKDFEDRRRYKGSQNPVATTWLISFEHIARDNPVAARYLKFICFLAEKDIPVSLLPPASDQLEADEAIGILKAYAFITSRESHDSFDMHRLVRLATQNWLDKEGKHEECVTEVLHCLERAVPPPQIGNKDTWIKYLPHLKAAIGSRERPADLRALALLDWADWLWDGYGLLHMWLDYR
ncbi:hypothetical protein CNMCM5793_006507 [Aspergillus hiratsukae]|uniref:NB-ARC domain-containing protein n=1 Tax=Aspergillus hiratsukae TaxID=1194566 RepID=A0A8H6UZK6_9EURO|nr:hypothetical protein CNMCM5793_006507 [Aspergillus hiratsukae]KAF7173068.1 hypothetical protein CNMCM6106_007195 [Aspergillus hiratsukae]